MEYSVQVKLYTLVNFSQEFITHWPSGDLGELDTHTKKGIHDPGSASGLARLARLISESHGQPSSSCLFKSKLNDQKYLPLFSKATGHGARIF